MLSFSWTTIPQLRGACIYQRQAYQALMAKKLGASVQYLQLSDVNGGVSYLPLLVRRVFARTSEAFSAHGYGGLFGDNVLLRQCDIKQLSLFLAEAGICCLFVRHAPFLANQRYWPESTLTLNRITHQVDLRLNASIQEYLQTLPQKLRASINHAIRSQLRFEKTNSITLEADLATFHSLYSERMRLLNAESFYRFDRSFFHEQSKQLANSCVLMTVRSEPLGEMVAGAVFLIDFEHSHVHYHLSAATVEGMRHQAMEFLLGMAIYEFGREGFKLMHLGGGHTLEETDGLSRFKYKFSNKRLGFYISKLICDPATYHGLREEIPLKHPSLFLLGDAIGIGT